MYKICNHHAIRKRDDELYDYLQNVDSMTVSSVFLFYVFCNFLHFIVFFTVWLRFMHIANTYYFEIAVSSYYGCWHYIISFL